jgi:hypothetical protein
VRKGGRRSCEDKTGKEGGRSRAMGVISGHESTFRIEGKSLVLL